MPYYYILHQNLPVFVFTLSLQLILSDFAGSMLHTLCNIAQIVFVTLVYQERYTSLIQTPLL